MNAEKQRQNNLSKDQKQSVFLYLLQRSGQKKKLPNGIARDAAAHFQMSTRLVTKIWTKGRECSPENAHEILKSFSPKRKGRVGRKSKEILAHVIKAVPIKKRRTVRALAKQIGVPKSTLQDAVKAGKIKRHSNSLKPELTEETVCGIAFVRLFQKQLMTILCLEVFMTSCMWMRSGFTSQR